MRHYYTTEGITYQTDWIIKHVQVDAMHHMHNYKLALGGVLRWADISKLYRACETFLHSYYKASLNLRRYAHGPLTARLMDIAHRNGNSWLKPQAPIWLAGFQTIYVIQSAQVFNHFFSLLVWYHLLKISVSKTSCKQTVVGCFTCQSDGLCGRFFGQINSKVDQTLCWKSEVLLCKMWFRIINTMLI